MTMAYENEIVVINDSLFIRWPHFRIIVQRGLPALEKKTCSSLLLVWYTSLSALLYIGLTFSIRSTFYPVLPTVSFIVSACYRTAM